MADGGFNYSGFSPEITSDLERLAKDILAKEEKLTRGGVAIGVALLAAKRHLKHGLFRKWCDLVLGYDARTAQRYMNAARLWQLHGDDVFRLPFTVAQDLGAESVDPNLVHEVLARVRRGERVRVKWVRERLRPCNGDKTQEKSLSEHSEIMAAMITKELDLRHCKLLVAFVAERPSARLFISDLAEHAAAKISRSRGRRAQPEPLSLTAG